MELRTYQDLYCWLRKQLHFRENGDNESRWLVEALTGRNYIDVLNEPFTTSLFPYSEAINRLKEDVPFQYVVGHEDFYGLTFAVGPEVLIPRPETEVLVAAAIDWGRGKNLSILDLCTGSGCIVITLAKYLKATGNGVDIAPAALALAKKNAALHCVNVNFYCGDLFTPLKKGEKFDLITANPPYLDSREMAAVPKTLTYEPSLALFGGEDGLSFYRSIVAKAPQFLKRNGLLLMEIGATQGEDLLNMTDNIFKKTKIIKDLAGKPRVFWGEALQESNI